MNRRHFLQKSSLAASIFIFPKAIRGENKPSLYESAAMSVDRDTHVFYKLYVYHNTIQNLTAAAENEKFILLKAKTTPSDDWTKVKETSEFKYKISSAELTNDEEKRWQVKAKADSKTGGFKLPEDLDKKMNFLCKLEVSGSIESKKNYPLVTFTYHEPSDDDDDSCFLTTACVHYKGLADDCEELHTIRFLRDCYMTTNEEGRQLIKEYRTAGPAIVKTVNGFSNKAVIYEYMYDFLVQPSVQLIHQGRYAEAVEYYKNFVQAIQQEYCQNFY